MEAELCSISSQLYSTEYRVAPTWLSTRTLHCHFRSPTLSAESTWYELQCTSGWNSGESRIIFS